jgi:hypothetical protein
MGRIIVSQVLLEAVDGGRLVVVVIAIAIVGIESEGRRGYTTNIAQTNQGQQLC